MPFAIPTPGRLCAPKTGARKPSKPEVSYMLMSSAIPTPDRLRAPKMDAVGLLKRENSYACMPSATLTRVPFSVPLMGAVVRSNADTLYGYTIACTLMCGRLHVRLTDVVKHSGTVVRCSVMSVITPRHNTGMWLKMHGGAFTYSLMIYSICMTLDET